MFHIDPGGITEDNAAHFKELFPAQINYVWIREGLVSSSLIYRAPDALNVGPGAAAHMSLHLD